MFDKFWDAVFLVRRLYDRFLRPVCEDYGLTRMELDILLFLINNPSYDTARDIVSRRRLTKSHVSASVKRLTELGYLQQSFQGENKKTVHLGVAGAAREVIRRGQRAQKAFFDILLEGLTPGETAAIREGMGKMAQNVRAALAQGSKP